ncbi:indoleamine 2,3-dioxygenase 1 [Ornithorhynchus anatinus]|uniref:Indoleamine 2,3-dioxygenase 1 n=1 Tax=Ornithorhynchus anatinus TaxID=9258 RepID=B3Y9H6_ORNAN|nr:indoleamine 2,3-dioxygenase 1 [Ornithorhynchus anatinus]BAG68602.1 indoleamine 2,3-dioxygenase [Ornithorhynchus anatinus]
MALKEKSHLENPRSILEKFHVSEEFGFVLSDPLVELPEYYAPWMKIATELTSLIETKQLHAEVQKLPLLTIDQLQGHRELRLAHLALGFITMGYVWQEGDKNAAKILPKKIAVPFCQISEKLDLPPVLVYADCILANWKKKDPNRPMDLENLDTIVSLPGGDNSKAFFLVSLLVELAAASAVKVIPVIMDALSREDASSLQIALHELTSSVQKTQDAFTLIHDHVDSTCYYETLRIFLSGWKDNPLLPDGLLYEGVWKTPKEFSGGSAAQSTIIQCFDLLLGIQHSSRDEAAANFLKRMRDYMPPAHRDFLQLVASGPTVRPFVLSKGDPDLQKAFDKCVSALVALRNYHLKVVAKYIVWPGQKLQREENQKEGLQKELVALEKGTGGTGFMQFLKTVRDSTRKSLLKEY